MNALAHSLLIAFAVGLAVALAGAVLAAAFAPNRGMSS